MNREEKIQRNDFLKRLGFMGASLFALYTLESCEQPEVVSGEELVIDLSAKANQVLNTVGGFLVSNGIVVANHNGHYVAATLKCSHAGEEKIKFEQEQWHCTVHHARFDLNGDVVKKAEGYGATSKLKVYTVKKIGLALHIPL